MQSINKLSTISKLSLIIKKENTIPKSKYVRNVIISLFSECCPYIHVWIKNIIASPIKINTMPILELV